MGSDKNHTGLSPHGISEICGFVLTSDQVHYRGSMIIGLINGTYFSHGFGTYSHIFGCIPIVDMKWVSYAVENPHSWHEVGFLCCAMGMIHFNILLLYLCRFKYLVPKLHDSCRNFLPYSSYVPSTLIPTKPTYHHMLLTCQSLIPSLRQTTSVHLTFPPDITPSDN